MFLFEPTPKPPRVPWYGTLAIEPLQSHVCPDCSALLHTDQRGDARALFWMHGYGAVIRTTWRTCPCGYRRHWRTETITPRTN